MKKSKKVFVKILPYLKDKYIITVLFLVIWLSFIDNNDFISQYKYRQELSQLRSEKQYLEDEITRNKKDLHELMSSPENLEKFAREKFYMKKKDEDVFVLVYNSPQPKKKK